MEKLFACVSRCFTKPSKSNESLNYTNHQGVLTFKKEFNKSIETCIYIIIASHSHSVIFEKNHWYFKNHPILIIPCDVIHLNNPPTITIDLPKYLKSFLVQNSMWFYVPKYLEKLECYECKFSCILLCKNIRVLNTQSCKFGNYCFPKSITHLILYGPHCRVRCVDKLTKNLHYLNYSPSPENRQSIKLPKHTKYVKLGPFFTCIVQIPKLVQRLNVYWFFNDRTIIPDTLRIFNMESSNASIIDNLPNGLERFCSGSFNVITCNVPSKLIHEQLVPFYK